MYVHPTYAVCLPVCLSMIQGVWVFLTALPVFLTLTLSPPSSSSSSLCTRDLLGLSLWLLGFSLEVVADRQKQAWTDKTRFVNTGLWALSRHPNCEYP